MTDPNKLEKIVSIAMFGGIGLGFALGVAFAILI